MAFTTQELYKRIMRVEKLCEIIEGSGVDIKATLKETGLGQLLTHKGGVRKTTGI